MIRKLSEIFRKMGMICAMGCGLFIFGISTVQAMEATSTFPNDPHWNKQWYLRQISAPDAWTVTTGSRSVIVAVIDGGVDIGHPDVKNNIWVNDREIPGDGIDNENDGLVDDVHGWNFVSASGDVRPVWKAVQYEEPWSHGTLTATLIGAKGDNGTGMAGMAWNVRLMPLVVLDADGSGRIPQVVAAINYAVSHGAGVINMSFVGYDHEPELEQAIKNAADAGVVLVAATGNGELKQGYDIDQSLAYPVCYDGGANQMIGVSGTDVLDQRAPYANYGRRCTDVSAPGHTIFAGRPSYPHDTKPPDQVPAYLDGMNGTSLAAPLVSGVAALIRSERPDLSAAQVRQRIMETVDSTDTLLPEASRGVMGRGRLNAGRALQGLRTWNPDPRFSVGTPSSAPVPDVKEATERSSEKDRLAFARVLKRVQQTPVWRRWLSSSL